MKIEISFLIFSPVNTATSGIDVDYSVQVGHNPPTLLS